MAFAAAEREFVLRCLRTLVRPEASALGAEASTLEGQAAELLDWSHITSVCAEARLLPFIAFTCERAGLFEKLPAGARARLTASMLECEAHLALRRKQFQSVRRLLELSDIEVIPLKGIALAELIYREFPFRVMGDIDLLIPVESVDRTLAILQKEGFRRDSDARPSCQRWHDQILAQSDYAEVQGRVNLSGSFAIDLHWAPRYIVGHRQIGLDYPAVWRRARPRPQLGKNVRVLSAPDQASYLMLHLLESPVPEPIQLLDLALLLAQHHLPATGICAEIPLRPSERAAVRKIADAIEKLFLGELAEIPLTDSARGFALGSGRKKERHLVERILRIPTLRQRMLFLLGYLVPSRSYYRDQSMVAMVREHWRRLFQALS